MKKNESLRELLYQLADDNFIHAFRGSEWLGLVPHIEEDVAYSSISQDTMGHAYMFYQLLEDLGEGNLDQIAHGRKPEQFRNAIILEEKNGPGSYLEKPDYDWAFTVVRNLLYSHFKTIQLESLKQSSYEPLSIVSRKIQSEQYYHLMHWETWFTQLMLSTEVARTKMEDAIKRIWKDLGGLISLGNYGDEISANQYIDSEQKLETRFLESIEKEFKKVEFTIDENPGMLRGNGRNGEHTEDLKQAIETLSEVYLSDLEAASW
jgi:ring-1,2-phenylacetyl-CoA epoxidase subunit PaaC